MCDPGRPIRPPPIGPEGSYGPSDGVRAEEQGERLVRAQRRTRALPSGGQRSTARVADLAVGARARPRTRRAPRACPPSRRPARDPVTLTASCTSASRRAPRAMASAQACDTAPCSCRIALGTPSALSFHSLA